MESDRSARGPAGGDEHSGGRRRGLTAAFDPANKYVFASGSDETLTLAHVDSADKLSLVQTLKTPARARTMALDPKTHNIYLATAQFETAPPPAPGAPRVRPKMVPGSFSVAVFSMKAPS